MHPRMIKKRIFTKKMRPAAGQFFYETKCAANKTYQTKCAAGRIFGLSPHGYFVLLMQYVIYFPRIAAQNLLLLINFVNSFFNELIHSLINELINLWAIVRLFSPLVCARPLLALGSC